MGPWSRELWTLEAVAQAAGAGIEGWWRPDGAAAPQLVRYRQEMCYVLDQGRSKSYGKFSQALEGLFFAEPEVRMGLHHLA